MFYTISLRRENTISLLIIFFLISLVFNCAQAPVKKEFTGITEEKPAQIESIKVIPDPSGEKTMIEITSSKLISYAAFTLVQPLRLIVDLNALPAQGLTGPGVINDRLVKNIHFEKVKDRPLSTRLIATLTQDVEYHVREEDKTVKFLLSPKKTVEIAVKQPPSLPAKEEEMAVKKPRLFFSPSKTTLNQILGVDSYMLSKGKSRVTVTTTKKAEYDLSRKNSLTLLLQIIDSTIPSELTRYLNTSLFKGAVNQITPIIKVAEKQVDLEIELKEMVPYHVVQTDKEIRLDFNKTSVKPPTKKIPQTKLSMTLVKPKEVTPEVKPVTTPISMTRPVKRYTGAKVTFDFANADIRNILKLIGEVSKLNIVWGSEVKGTASMRLKNVPWDQALDVVLEANDLGMRRDGNIIWVTTKEKIKALEEEEEEKRKAKLDSIKEEQDERKRDRELEKELEPLITEYIPVNFRVAEELKDFIMLSERGSIKVDKVANTIIIKDIESIIKDAKKVLKERDIPPKQIMIEARIVDASTGFSRDLGVRWDSIERKWQSRIGMGWESDPTAFGHYRDQYFGGSFSSNIPGGWSPNIGLSFATLTNKGLGTLTLDASLALAETEGKIKIISAPKVIASNGQEAEISRGDIIYKEIVTADQRDIKELEATLSLIVKPTVSFNNYVTMDIEVKDDKVYADLSGKTKKSIKTKLMVKSGDTVVIGGIFKEDKAESETGIPGLSKIPLLGWLFKAQSKTRSRSELLIFLTPTVLERDYKAEK